MEGSPLEKLDEWLMRGHPLQDARLAVTEWRPLQRGGAVGRLGQLH